MPQHEEFSLDRNESISKNIDATGKKWRIEPVRGLALYKVTAMDERVTIPKSIGGWWTKAEWLQERLDRYLEQSWDQADLKTKKEERTIQAKKESKKKSIFE